MQEIPKPELLDPNRVDRDDRADMTLEDHRSRAQLLGKALDESCAYAQQLWDQVDALRSYLLDTLPPDPRAPGPHNVTSAHPTGPDDAEGWQNWINAFATTTSVLCGAHGDSGFGLSRAREEAQLRRTAPELQMHAEHPQLALPEPQSSGAAQQPTGGSISAPQRSAASTMKTVGTAALAVLAVRGLLPRPKAARRSGADG